MNRESPGIVTPIPKMKHFLPTLIVPGLKMTTSVYGCHNRKEYLYWVQTAGGNGPEIPFSMTRECQYTKTYLGQKDTKCVGCSWRKTASKE